MNGEQEMKPFRFSVHRAVNGHSKGSLLLVHSSPFTEILTGPVRFGFQIFCSQGCEPFTRLVNGEQEMKPFRFSVHRAVNGNSKGSLLLVHRSPFTEILTGPVRFGSLY